MTSRKAADPRDATRPKVPPFARYKGTSAWKKYPRRVHAYALHRAAGAASAQPA